MVRTTCEYDIGLGGHLLSHEATVTIGDEYEAWLGGQPGAPFVPDAIDEDDVCELFYTSGTTGEPKGVMLTHRNLHTHAVDSALKVTSLRLPTCRPEIRHVYHQYVVRCEQRDALGKFLHENGIGTLVHYPVPVHLQPAYRDIAVHPGDLHNSEQSAAQVLSLPMYAELSPVEIHSVTEAILTWDRSK